MFISATAPGRSHSTSPDNLRNQMWIDGHIQGDNLAGGLRMFAGTNTVEVEWMAQRSDADFTGTWEWPGVSNAPVRLQISRRDGRLAATCADMNRQKDAWRDETRPVPVIDFYDFGGGFYFTLLWGMEGQSLSRGSRRIGPQDGWLVGEAVMEDGTLKGTIAFYPHSEPTRRPATPAQPAPRAWRNWQPKRVAP